MRNFEKGDIILYISLEKKRNKEYNIGKVVETDQKWVKIRPLFHFKGENLVWELQDRVVKV